jgi:hypothetical protein
MPCRSGGQIDDYSHQYPVKSHKIGQIAHRKNPVDNVGFIALMKIMAYIPLTYVTVAHTLVGKEKASETDAQHTRLFQEVSHG